MTSKELADQILLVAISWPGKKKVGRKWVKMSATERIAEMIDASKLEVIHEMIYLNRGNPERKL